MSLVRRREQTVASWVIDAEALYLFAGPSLTWPFDGDQLAEMEAQDANLSAWMLSDDGEAWGHFDLRIEHRNARLGRIIIDPRRRGQGLARTLVAAAVERSRDYGVAEVGLNVIRNNVAAFRTYERLGFHPLGVGTRPDYVPMALAIPKPRQKEIRDNQH